MEGLKALRNRVVMSPFNLDLRGGDHSPEDQLQVSAYGHSLLSQLGFPNWKVRLDDGPTLNQQKVVLEQKILEDLAWIFDPIVHFQNVTSLTLNCEVVSVSTSRML